MSWLSSRQRSIFGTISCSSRIDCSTRASVEKPVLPRRFFDSPSLSNRIAPSCCGEPIDELLAREVPDLALEPGDLLGDARRRSPPSRSVSSRTPASSIVAQHRDQRQLDLVEQRLLAALGELLALAVARAPARSSASRGRRSSSTSVAEPALLAQLGERERAPRRVEQVGGEQRVVGEAAAGPTPSAFASCAITGRVAERRDELGRVGDLAVTTSLAARRRRTPSARSRANSSPSPARARAAATASGASPSPSRAASAGEPGAHARARPPRRTRRRRRRVVAERLLQPPQRVAQLELAEDLAQAASGRARARPPPPGRGRRGTSRCTVASTLLTRASSACLRRFSLRLAPEISSTCASTSSSVPNCLQQLRGGLVADARDAGDVVRRVALEPVEVGDQLGRDAVALDHRLVVVELGLGDAARGRHHPDPSTRVDQLEGVAVAGDDHHRHALPRWPARRASRSRRRPRSPPPRRCGSRTPRRAARSAATARAAGPGASVRWALYSLVDLLAARRARRPSTTIVGFGPCSVSIFTSIEAKPEDRVRRLAPGGRDRLRAARRTPGRRGCCRRSGTARRARAPDATAGLGARRAPT